MLGEAETAARPAVTATGGAAETAKIVLLAGRVKVPDRVGHHDYLAGCSLLADLLQQTPGVRAVAVRDGWPEDEDEGVFDDARSVVFYTGGGRKNALFRSGRRVERVQALVDRGVGIVSIHQAVRFPPEFAGLAPDWIGGSHGSGKSGRGHWTTSHREFPAHPVSSGVQPWKIRDGWLNEMQFVDGMNGVTPLVWSGKKHRGSPLGGVDDVVSWTYERPRQGRSFCFTGLDAHSAWSVAGVRQLMVNGILWSAGLSVPASGAFCTVDETTLRRYLTARGSRLQWLSRALQRPLRRKRGR